jgi:hypothetical protein
VVSLLSNASLQRNIRLLYRASQHGWTGADFRARCNEQGPTITLVRVADSNCVFGAYVSVSWPSIPEGKWFAPVADESKTSFLFSLSNSYNRPLKFRLRNEKFAIYGHTSHGPVFGGTQNPADSPDIILGIKRDNGPATPVVAVSPVAPPAAIGGAGGGGQQAPIAYANPAVSTGAAEKNASSCAVFPFNHPGGNSINTPVSYVIDEQCEIDAGLPSTSGIVHDRRLLASSARFKCQEIEVFAVTPHRG